LEAAVGAANFFRPSAEIGPIEWPVRARKNYVFQYVVGAGELICGLRARMVLNACNPIINMVPYQCDVERNG